jgi:carboxyl-terminal processing protease
MLEVLNDPYTQYFNAEEYEQILSYFEDGGETVQLEMCGENEDIAHITISHFSQSTPSELESILKGDEVQEADGIILDLRGNPGGLVKETVSVASQFLDKGDVILSAAYGHGIERVWKIESETPDGITISVSDSQGYRDEWSVDNCNVPDEMPVVILVNDETASASEIVAGALKDYERAYLIGTKTYGKGSMCILYPLSDGSALCVTCARCYTPDGYCVGGVGLTPDKWISGSDAQLDEAIQYIKNHEAGRDSLTGLIEEGVLVGV